MEELRCNCCGRKLAEFAGLVRINIKCSRCKTVNAFSMAESAPSAESHALACHRASIQKDAHVCRKIPPHRR
ncbi:Com family DNA-binding transcriptional regulator [Achromobacter xylosoxidans]|uniref:Com family DNA-binding transcriptional regulator n=1 Tax=Alcaligenes xylosoxydans xylosoxydans TaxID=85698 RepID=UPI001231F5C7|nr:Com family DNA-binding transcriptional regulator [Achromobacter xylosoxidans]KAA5924221.1 Com family DNA-binding transcriptional regulator [Achromobacter xylosoxidans]